MVQKKYQITIDPTIQKKAFKSGISVGTISNKLRLIRGITVNDIAILVKKAHTYTRLGKLYIDLKKSLRSIQSNSTDSLLELSDKQLLLPYILMVQISEHRTVGLALI